MNPQKHVMKVVGVLVVIVIAVFFIVKFGGNSGQTGKVYNPASMTVDTSHPGINNCNPNNTGSTCTSTCDQGNPPTCFHHSVYTYSNGTTCDNVAAGACPIVVNPGHTTTPAN